MHWCEYRYSDNLQGITGKQFVCCPLVSKLETWKYFNTFKVELTSGLRKSHMQRSDVDDNNLDHIYTADLWSVQLSCHMKQLWYGYSIICFAFLRLLWSLGTGISCSMQHISCRHQAIYFSAWNYKKGLSLAFSDGFVCFFLMASDRILTQ